MQIEDIIEKIRQNKSQYGITLYEPADKSDIDKFDNALKITLPEDVKRFYEFCNGFESGEDWFRIIPLHESIDQMKKYKPNHFYIAEYMVYCDFWEIVVDSHNDSYTIMEGSYKTILTDSFTEFLNRFLTGGVFETGGLYEWKHEVNNRED